MKAVTIAILLVLLAGCNSQRLGYAVIGGLNGAANTRVYQPVYHLRPVHPWFNQMTCRNYYGTTTCNW